jgi:hypothetical protein
LTCIKPAPVRGDAPRRPTLNAKAPEPRKERESVFAGWDERGTATFTARRPAPKDEGSVMRYRFPLAAAVALAGCAASAGDGWVRPGTEPVTAHEDRLDCEDMARTALLRPAATPNEDLGTSGSSLPRNVPRPDRLGAVEGRGGNAGVVADRCMAERGYSRIAR